VLIVVALVATVWYLVANARADDGALTASGTIEAVQVHLSPELAGRVSEVNVNDGDVIQAGDALFRLDGALLRAQRAAAEAALETARAAEASAQAQYDLAAAAAQAESLAARAQEWRVSAITGSDQPGWYFTQSEQLTAAQAELAAAEAALPGLQSALTELAASAGAEFARAETRLANARFALQVAGDVLTRARLSGDADLVDAAQAAYDAADDDLQAAQDAYEALLDSDAAQAVLEARAALAVAGARVQAAHDRLIALQTGEQSLKLAAAARALEQAQAAVAQAEAQITLLDVQIGKLTVYAPVDAVVLTRSIQVGEVVQPGATAVTLLRLADLTITVYVPEDRYGVLFVGQSAVLTADSFPDETFAATVVYISDQAEFTPRNVQTVEGRSSTVYAIRLRIDDPEGRLKAGMPADVVFEGTE